MRKLFIGGMFVVLAGFSLACGLNVDSTDSADRVVESNSSNSPKPNVEVVPPKAEDFEFTVKHTSQKCFGSAGCNVEYRVNFEYDGVRPNPSSYLVTYEITGDESGPILDSFTMTVCSDNPDAWCGDGIFEGLASTKNKDVKLTAKVVDIEKL